MAVAGLPPDIGTALAADPAAAKAFSRLAPSHVREYLLWVDEAKRVPTRQRRIGQMIERLKGHKTQRGNGDEG